ncbi:MAG: c-type cytochrome [Rhodocyclaceae bacterium]|jgi:cytochrome c553|nr:c-type cytochrome [Rhodocyclaceae bacterium]
MPTNLLTPLAATLLLATLALPAQAAPTRYQVRAWAASCAACHGTDGSGKPGTHRLAGREQDELITALREFKAGKRPATVMHQHAKGYSDEQLELLAAWFAAQPKP